MAEKLAHHELAKPPGASCNDHTHASAPQCAEPTALIQFLQEAVIDKICGFGFTRLFSGGAFENLIDSFGAHVRDRVAGVAHTIDLVELAERFSLANFRVLGKRFHAEISIRAQPVQSLAEAPEKAQDAVAIQANIRSGGGERGIGKDDSQ